MLFLAHGDFSYIFSGYLYVNPKLVQILEQDPLSMDTMRGKSLLLLSHPFWPALSGDGLLKRGLF